MTPERHRQIGELFERALEVAPAARAQFLNDACAGDDALRREVESLLRSHQDADEGTFISTPGVAAKAVAATPAALRLTTGVPGAVRSPWADRRRRYG